MPCFNEMKNKKDLVSAEICLPQGLFVCCNIRFLKNTKGTAKNTKATGSLPVAFAFPFANMFTKNILS
ncbi:MAG TPA: hypothetical protein DDY98_05980 [Ruminococcaceae bacterium]|nr:hypothetical protein [Oscillospiraceae bacterium]